ncbi:hypothetical protein AYO21_02953 [Fonsecaea monophora]|uniref:Methyltransferase domain-containing protein n=1 Tax=Fonsecaea monophora TaxID=254056 RepID=A0A177FGC7_9EURO|nr:hypothetical protein AYO21_02953 [Fonsecaea monophora]OAG42670.1 hypothetical protein AYO21_02953 [Fonsecaea monophora]
MATGQSDREASISSEGNLLVDHDYRVRKDDQSDADSGFDGGPQSLLSESVRSSVYNYRYENGRTYHSYREGAYYLPNDEEEQDRLDLLHHICKMLLGGELFTAPLPSDPHRILDVGTGTGIWAVEIADQFPSAQVIGTDLSPIQPPWVPPNLQFYVDDAEADWTWAENEKFDFIHARGLCGGIGDWPRFYAQAFRNLKPGGWIELQEHAVNFFSDDGGLERATACVSAIAQLQQASDRVGKPLNVAHLHKRWMLQAGFQDVEEVVKKVPIGPWAKDRKLKEIGVLYRIQMLQSVPSFMLAYYKRVLHHSDEVTETAMAEVKEEFVDRRLHLYQRWYFVKGRKPG